ncbi:uncharacterized protein LOC111310573 [Durio zibethinus]|uniref:Uncharacterized protein LOC111310573 n=1 Tax=Durio zibethinus TaxID=66656 RepID=A0A6P6ALQ8_DURZI|nr:uncharacterized protein LOC111310573 [Durio zibethinus]
MKEIRKHMEFFIQVAFAQAGPSHGDLPLPPQGPEDDLTARIGSTASAGIGGDQGRTLTESLLRDHWFIDMMNNNELKSGPSSCSMIMNDMGLPYYLFAGSEADDLGLPSTAVMGLPPYGNIRCPTTDMGMPPLSFRSNGAASEMGLPYGSVRDSSFVPFGCDIGLGLHPFSGHIGSSFARSRD